MNQAPYGADRAGVMNELHGSIVRILSGWDVASSDAEAIASKTTSELTSRFGGASFYFSMSANVPPSASQTRLRSQQFLSALAETVFYELRLLSNLDELDAGEAAEEARNEVAALFAGQNVYIPNNTVGHALQRAMRALDLSRQGKSRTEIAEALGVSYQAVCKMLKRAHGADMAVPP